MFRKLIAGCFIFAALGNNAYAGMCGNGIQCISPVVTLNNAAGTTAQAVYLVPTTSAGAEIVGLFCANNGSFSQTPLQISVLHNAVSYNLWQSYQSTSGGLIGSSGVETNLLNTSNAGPAAPMTGLPTDDYGNTFQNVSPGDTLQLGATVTLSGSNTITCRFIMRQY